MRVFLTGLLFQLRLTGKVPDTILVCATAPLLTAVLLAITEMTGREDLVGHAIVAPTLMALWQGALFMAGQLVTEERLSGTLDSLIAAPISVPVLLLGRLCAVASLGTVVFGESWLVAGVLFGHPVTVAHPVVFVAALLATALATAGTAVVLSPLFVLLPSARPVQNTLTYPLYLLSGVIVPVAYFPHWLEPLTRVVFLSWSADLLRDSLHSTATDRVAARLGAILVLGAVGWGVGTLLFRAILHRVRQHGTLSQV